MHGKAVADFRIRGEFRYGGDALPEPVSASTDFSFRVSSKNLYREHYFPNSQSSTASDSPFFAVA